MHAMYKKIWPVIMLLFFDTGVKISMHALDVHIDSVKINDFICAAQNNAADTKL